MNRTLIAINGSSFNDALKENYRLDPFGCRNRLHIDYRALRTLLEADDRNEGIEVSLNYYVSEPVLTSREIEELLLKIEDNKKREAGHRQRGKVIFFEKGRGEIKDFSGNKYSVVWQDIEGSGYKTLYLDDIVSFIGQKSEKGFLATTVRVGAGFSQEEYRLRKQSFYKTLQKFGYEVISSGSHPALNLGAMLRNHKSIDMQICLDAMELDEDDNFVLCSDDIDFAPLLRRLSKRGVFIQLAAFESELSDVLKREADEVIILDRRIGEIIAPEMDHKNGNGEAADYPNRRKRN